MASDFRLIEDATFVLPSLLGLVAELPIEVFGLSTFLRPPPSGTHGWLDQAIQHCIGSQVHDIFHSWLAVQKLQNLRRREPSIQPLSVALDDAVCQGLAHSKQFLAIRGIFKA